MDKGTPEGRLELRVAQLEAMLRLLHPEAFGDEEPDPEETRSERKRKWRIIAGEGEHAAIPGIAAVALAAGRRFRGHPWGYSLASVAAATALTTALLLPTPHPHHMRIAAPPQPPAASFQPPKVEHRRRAAPRPRPPRRFPDAPVTHASAPSGSPAPPRPGPTAPQAPSNPAPRPEPVPTVKQRGKKVCVKLPPLVGVCLGLTQPSAATEAAGTAVSADVALLALGATPGTSAVPALH